MALDAVNAMYATQIVSTFDLHKPEKSNQLFLRYGGHHAGFFQQLRAMGRDEAVANNTYSHFEEKRIHQAFKVRTQVSAPGAGANAAITLHVDDLDASNRFYVRKWDQVMFPNEVTGKVISVNVSTPSAPVITVKPDQAADDIGLLAADSHVIIISNAHSEASGQPSGRFRGADEEYNYLQRIKETISVTGDEMTNWSWINVTSEGQQLATYWSTAMLDLEYRAARAVGYALMFSKATTNTATDSDTGNDVLTTEGLFPATRRRGNTLQRSTGAATVSDFDLIDRTLEAEGSKSMMGVYCGTTRHQNFENVLVSYFADTNIQYAKQAVNDALFYGDESKSAAINFKYLTKSERTYMFNRMNEFSDPVGGGNEDFKLTDHALFIPISKVKDGKTSKMVDNIGTRHKAWAGYNRKFEMYDINGAGNKLKVSQFDKNDTFIRCQIGGQWRGLNQALLLYR